MGKSTASCFKIIACGSDSVDHGDLQTPESKVSSTRSGWSFRKRSARHRVLINTIISEAPSFTDKESPESIATSLRAQPNFTEPEKASVIQRADEKNKVSAQVDSNLSDIIAAKEDECSTDATLEESSAILIQAAIRGYLARRMLLKQKNIIKMQAAVRGHLVRRHAVGTLRLLLAIVKMQALVRARHDRDFENQKKNSAVDDLNPTIMRSKRKAKVNGTDTSISTEKLHSNKFACQLMESMPRTKPINIKCDPEKSGSAWKWIERWMSISSVSNGERDKSGSALEQHEKESLGYSDGRGNTLDPSDFQSESIGLKSEKGENLFTDDADDLDIHASLDSPINSLPNQNFEEFNLRYDIAESGAAEMRETDLIQKMDETGNQQVIHASEKSSIELPETERKRFSCEGSNPSFNDSHLKFEEPLEFGEIGQSDASISNPVAVQDSSSECGTELSITSTLDSPDMSDEGVYDLELEPKILDADPSKSRENLGHEAFENSSILGTELSYANIDHLERNEIVQLSAGGNSVIDSNSPTHEKKLESDQSKEKSSPPVSPKSCVTKPESQTTPSRQVSLNSKKSTGRKIESNDKKRLSADKSLILTPSRNSATESSLKSLEETKTGKRRKSFGSTKLDHTDQEPREGSSRNSLPSYMQPTESARAKALSTGSLRSSPDVQERDIFIKNRPFHPGRNEREGSPRVQHSPSQAQQNAKGNGIHSPQDRKWLR